MPILSVFLGYIFFKEKLNIKRALSIGLVVLSVCFLLIFNFQSIPWVGLIVALSWGFYNLLRKKINVDTDVGLLIESLFILPFAVVAFYILKFGGKVDAIIDTSSKLDWIKSTLSLKIKKYPNLRGSL